MFDLESIQEILEDAMEMVENPDLVPPSVSIEMKDAIQAILAGWINAQMQDLDPDDVENSAKTLVQLVEMATGCAYLVGRLEGMKDEVSREAGESVTYNFEPTHPEGQTVTLNFNFR